MKILLDTSLLLPTLGIEVERAERVLKKLSGNKLYYSDYSILECLWVASSLKKKGEFKEEIFEIGIRSILEGYMKAEVNTEAVFKAFEIYELGYRDLIDCILYSTALHSNMKFATLDEELKKFVRGNRLKEIFFEY